MPESLAPGVYVEEVGFRAKPIEGVSTSTTGFLGSAARGPVGEAVQVHRFVDFERIFGGLQANVALGYAVLQFFQNGGSDARVVRVNDDHEIAAALLAFDTVDSIATLSVPGCANVETLQAALAYSDQHRSFLVVDPPAADPQAAQDLAATLGATHSANAAVYFPRLMVADPLSGGVPRSVPPSGAITGMIARMDSQSGVWSQPAGLDATLVGVLGLQTDIDETAAHSLAEAGVNAIRSIPGSGAVVWAARTVSSDDQWKYIPVRRLTLFLERSLARGLNWAVFEPNDESLWILLRSSVKTFMWSLWNQGAFKGQTPDEAFLVKGGRDVTMPTDLKSGRTVLLVGFAPTKALDFVLLKVTVQLNTSG
jgi:uncharacterized protein